MIGVDRFAAMNLVYNRYSFEYFLDSLERLGVRKFEFWTGTPHLFTMVDSMNSPETIKREVEARELEIVCVTPEQVLYPYNIAAPNEDLRKLSVDYFIRNIEVAATLEVDKMLCGPGWGNYDEDWDTAFGRMIDSLGPMVERAEALGVTLAFEVLSTFETNLVNNLASARKVFDAIQSPAFQLCVDTVAVNLGGDTLEEYLEAFAGRITHFHLTDGSPAGHVPLGEGELPADKYLQLLDASGYQGNVTLEIGDTQCCARPEEATKTAFDNLKKIL